MIWLKVHPIGRVISLKMQTANLSTLVRPSGVSSFEVDLPEVRFRMCEPADGSGTGGGGLSVRQGCWSLTPGT